MNAPAQTFTLRELVETCLHDRRRIALGFAIPMALAVLMAVLAGSYYQASATLLARMGPEYLYRGPVGDNAPVGFEREQSLKSEITILTSRDLVEKVVQSLGAARLYPGQSEAGATERFMVGLDAQLLKESNVIQVSFRHGDSKLAAEAVNRLVDLYLERRRDIYFDPRVDALDGQVKRIHQDLGKLDVQTEAFKKGKGIVAFDEQRALLLHQRAELDAKVKAATNTLAETRSKLAEQRANIDAAERLGRLAVLDAVEGDVLKLQADERSAMVAQAVQSGQLAEVDARITGLAQAEREMERLRREQAMTADTYQTYTRKLEEARILEIMDRRQQASVRLIQAARPPLRAISYRSAILVVGGALALVSAMVVGFIAEWRRDTFLTPEAVERALGIPVIGEFPAKQVRS